MVDLQTQYQHIKADIDAGIQEVIDSAAFIKGPKVAAFQEHLEAYTGAKHVIPVGNGTDALQIALMGLGLKPGDEVITPTFTFIATAEVVALLGLTPVVVDVDWETMNMDIEAVRRAITPRTKAIVPVHLFGQCADMEALMALAKEKHIYVVEDACQAIGAQFTFANGEMFGLPTATAPHVDVVASSTTVDVYKVEVVSGSAVAECWFAAKPAVIYQSGTGRLQLAADADGKVGVEVAVQLTDHGRRDGNRVVRLVDRR